MSWMERTWRRGPFVLSILHPRYWSRLRLFWDEGLPCRWVCIEWGDGNGDPAWSIVVDLDRWDGWR